MNDQHLGLAMVGYGTDACVLRLLDCVGCSTISGVGACQFAARAGKFDGSDGQRREVLGKPFILLPLAL